MYIIAPLRIDGAGCIGGGIIGGDLMDSSFRRVWYKWCCTIATYDSGYFLTSLADIWKWNEEAPAKCIIERGK